jgi:hypothetical protein
VQVALEAQLAVLETALPSSSSDTPAALKQTRHTLRFIVQVIADEDAAAVWPHSTASFDIRSTTETSNSVAVQAAL